MSHIDFEEIYWNNFHSYETGRLIIQPGKHLILGETIPSTSEDSNGSGKSTPFETLPWTLMDYYNREDPTRDGLGNCLTGVKFRKNNSSYKIEKIYKDEKLGNTLKIFENDEDISHRKTVSIKEERKRIIQFSADSFISTVVVMQQLPVNFTQLTPTLRKSVVEDILGFSVWNNFRPKFTGTLRELGLEQNKLVSDHNSKRDKMVGLNTKLETLKGVSTNQQTVYEEQIKIVKDKLDLVDEHINKLTKERESFDIKLQELNDYIDGLKVSVYTMKHRSEGLKSIVDNKICGQCEQSFPESRINGALGELDHVKTKLEVISKVLTESNEKKVKLQAIENELNETVQNKRVWNEKLKSIQYSWGKGEVKEDLNVLEVQVNDLLEEVNNLSTQLFGINKRVSNLEYLDSLLLPSSKFRTKVLEKYLNFINSIIESVVPMIISNVEAKLVVDAKSSGIEIEIMKKGKKRGYKSFSGGEKRKLDIIFILAFQKFLLENSGLSTNLLVLDEIFEGLDRKGIELFLNCLDVLFPQATSIYVITHNNTIKGLFNSILKVTKENDISTINTIAS
jgi:DNA repair exonuclease SbcCD ATPase subunit